MSLEHAWSVAKKRATEASVLLEVFEEANRIETENKQNEKLLNLKKGELKVVSSEVQGLIDKRNTKKKAMLSIDAKVDEMNTELQRLEKELKGKQATVVRVDASLRKTLTDLPVG